MEFDLKKCIEILYKLSYQNEDDRVLGFHLNVQKCYTKKLLCIYTVKSPFNNKENFTSRLECNNVEQISNKLQLIFGHKS